MFCACDILQKYIPSCVASATDALSPQTSSVPWKVLIIPRHSGRPLDALWTEAGVTQIL